MGNNITIYLKNRDYTGALACLSQYATTNSRKAELEALSDAVKGLSKESLSDGDTLRRFLSKEIAAKYISWQPVYIRLAYSQYGKNFADSFASLCEDTKLVPCGMDGGDDVPVVLFMDDYVQYDAVLMEKLSLAKTVVVVWVGYANFKKLPKGAIDDLNGGFPMDDNTDRHNLHILQMLVEKLIKLLK